MKHQLTKKTKLLQKALLIADSKVLVLKRASNSFSRPNKWDLPGGNSEWPSVTSDLKNPHELDLLREIKEETGLDVSEFWSNRRQPLCFNTYFESEKQVFSVIVIWQVNLPSTLMSQARLSQEHSEFRWVDLDRVLDELDFGFAGEPGGFIYEAVKMTLDSRL